MNNSSLKAASLVTGIKDKDLKMVRKWEQTKHETPFESM